MRFWAGLSFLTEVQYSVLPLATLKTYLWTNNRCKSIMSNRFPSELRQAGCLCSSSHWILCLRTNNYITCAQQKYLSLKNVTAQNSIFPCYQWKLMKLKSLLRDKGQIINHSSMQGPSRTVILTIWWVIYKNMLRQFIITIIISHFCCSHMHVTARDWGNCFPW